MLKLENLFLIVLLLYPAHVECGSGYYYAYPTNVMSHEDIHPELVKSKFYLQQVNMTTTALQGTLEIYSESIGPLSVRASGQPWTDTGFKMTSAGSRIIPGCAERSSLTQILASYTPAHLFNGTQCVMMKGKLKLSPVYLDEILNKQRKQSTYGRMLYQIDYIDNLKRSLFGFSLDLTVESRMSHFYGNGLIKEYKQELEQRKKEMKQRQGRV